LRPPKPPKRSGAVPVPERPDVAGLAAPVVEEAPPVVEAVAEDAPVVEATPLPAEPAADEAPVAEAPVAEAPERVDDLPAPADAETSEQVEAADPYDEGPASPEVVEAAIEEAVESAAPSADADDVPAEG
jgi:ribonuclease E